MYNLFVAYGADAWKQGLYEYDRSRVFEYTDNSITERYRDLAPDVIDELKSIPCLFCTEEESSASRVGYLIEIKVKDSKVRISFEFDPKVKAIRKGKIGDASIHFELGRFQLSRTHWSIRDENLWAVLDKIGIDTSQAKGRIGAIPSAAPLVATAPNPNKNQVFIVHGHDDVAKYEMAAELRAIGCEPVILHEQANAGMTIIEKIERYTNVGFAAILYTPCDVGGKRSEEISLSPRARQNVVFEHGYLIARLGRNRVMAFVKGRVETPSDISGVLYIPLDEKNLWKEALRAEMTAAGYKIKS